MGSLELCQSRRHHRDNSQVKSTSVTHQVAVSNSLATLLGTSIIGPTRSDSRQSPFRAVNPATGEAMPPNYWSATPADLDRATDLAAEAAPALEQVSGQARAEFLRKIASNIEALGQELQTRVAAESGLPAARVQGETARTCFQLRIFADIAEEGSWVDARIDPADPDRKPLRKPDVRSMQKPLGPIAVFGASNFPLAFSVGGGDTASALAAGNPVIVKAHPAHPGTSEMVANAIAEAVRACNLPDGTFSILFDSGYDIATALVQRPEIKAVGFTGSRKGGRALMNAIARREEPIPFFGELSSVNPLFFLPGMFAGDWEARVAGLTASLTGGSGQFCTKPGIIFVDQKNSAMFSARLGDALRKVGACTMLTSGIGAAFATAAAERSHRGGITTLVAGGPTSSLHQVMPALYQTDVSSYLADPILGEEMFGPAAVVISYSTPEELHKVARNLEGQLTATIHGDPSELADHKGLLALLEQKVGRLIFNGFPTGVEVGHAMVHGGPWPATSDSRWTSVGTRALLRFARPVCFQDFPQSLLPEELRDANPRGIARRIDGRLSKDALTVPKP